MLILLSLWIASQIFITSAYALTPVSTRKYSTKALLVQNPMDLTNLPPNEMFQVMAPDFILQFFFSGNRVLGFILSRNPQHPIHLRWCFYKSCEESPFDYKAVVAESQNPPFKENSFQVILPPRFNYNFQGMHWTGGTHPPVLP